MYVTQNKVGHKLVIIKLHLHHPLFMWASAIAFIGSIKKLPANRCVLLSVVLYECVVFINTIINALGERGRVGRGEICHDYLII